MALVRTLGNPTHRVNFQRAPYPPIHLRTQSDNGCDWGVARRSRTGVWRDLALVEPPQAPDLRELFVEWDLCGQM